jgi:hypothetical protein
LESTTVITGSSTQRVHEWIQTQSYAKQWTFGMEWLEKFGGAKDIINKFGGK